MNFVVANKKGINPSARENEDMGENVLKFLNDGYPKELVITVGNEPISINTFFYFEIL